MLFVLFLLSDSPLVAEVGIRVIPLFLIFAFHRLVSRRVRFGHAASHVRFGIALFLSTCLISAAVNQAVQPLLFGLLATIYLLVACTLNQSEAVRIVSLLSKVLLVTAALGLLALVLSAAGFASLFTVRSLEFVPFSLLYDNEPFKRVAGFMHEPGQLSFYICACVACREFLNLNRRESVLLLALGLLTQSLAHLVFTAFFVVYLMLGVFGRARDKKGRAFLMVIVVLVIVMGTGVLDWAVGRAAAFASSPEEWARFVSFNNAMNVLDSWRSLVLGPAPHLAARELASGETFADEFEGVSIYGENPLSPLIFGGLFASWPFYLFIVASALSFLRLKGKGLLLLAVALLTLQRPYTLEFPYALLIGLMVCIALNFAPANSVNGRSRRKRPRGGMTAAGGIGLQVGRGEAMTPVTLRNDT